MWQRLSGDWVSQIETWRRRRKVPLRVSDTHLQCHDVLAKMIIFDLDAVVVFLQRRVYGGFTNLILEFLDVCFLALPECSLY